MDKVNVLLAMDKVHTPQRAMDCGPCCYVKWLSKCIFKEWLSPSVCSFCMQ